MHPSTSLTACFPAAQRVVVNIFMDLSIRINEEMALTWLLLNLTRYWIIINYSTNDKNSFCPRLPFILTKVEDLHRSRLTHH